ncbi:MAG: DUF1638 domain-containing protein [Woeseiaceae bacterium]|nr:DUF1638 domain-containing protein [Woeseiaceae bacterium]
MPEPILVIACGALAREIIELRHANGWDHMHLTCIDATLHNRPGQIPERLRQRIRENAGRYSKIFAAYADCGTGGAIDRVLAEEGVERLPGAHCYEFYAGSERFAALANAEPGTFYLTDFLARHFERLVIRPLQLDEHPELHDSYFGNYERLVYLSQTNESALLQAAKAAARRLGLKFHHQHCGYGGLRSGLSAWAEGEKHGEEDSRLLA